MTTQIMFLFYNSHSISSEFLCSQMHIQNSVKESLLLEKNSSHVVTFMTCVSIGHAISFYYHDPLSELVKKLGNDL